jgi:hypothetical protein
MTALGHRPSPTLRQRGSAVGAREPTVHLTSRDGARAPKPHYVRGELCRRSSGGAEALTTCPPGSTGFGEMRTKAQRQIGECEA